MFFAHSNGNTDKTLWQPLYEHLRAVGRLSGANGQKFGGANAALLAGLLHDLGKYSVAFQRRLERVLGRRLECGGGRTGGERIRISNGRQ